MSLLRAVSSLSLLLHLVATVPSDLRPHPRLVLDDEGLQRVKRSITIYDDAKRYFSQLMNHGDEILYAPLLVHHIQPGDAHLLLVSRSAVDRVYTLALLYRLTGNKTWSDRCVKELVNVAGKNFSDWSPVHFLDTGEMTHAVAIGFDWLYDELSENDRATLIKGIVQKGFVPAQEAFTRNQFWTRNKGTNWNLVCNGGLIAGCLAIMDEDSAQPLTEEVYKNATAGIHAGFDTYADDGSWIEGPSYWQYATRYAVTAMNSLQTATGNDLGFSELEGVHNTGRWFIDNVGPTGYMFNHGDSSEHYHIGDEPSLFWFSQRYNNPLYAYYGRVAEMASDQSGVSWDVNRWDDLMFYNPNGTKEDLLKQSLESSYATQDGFFRSSWTDESGSFVGFKGGDNTVSHAHLDLGSFVYDAIGERWALDLGADNYSMPDYFGHLRWTYYRCMTRGHNTLTFDYTNQLTNGKASIVLFNATQTAHGVSFAIIDLTDAYSNATKGTVKRGIALLKDTEQLLVRDEISQGAINTSQMLVWSMHTMASVAVSGSTATLLTNGKTLTLRVTKPDDVTLAVQDINLKPPQYSTKGLHQISVAASAATEQSIEVFLGPGGNKPVATNPLAMWKDRGPLQTH